MAKYVLAYKGGTMARTPEAINAAMAAWGQWFGSLGPAVADSGNPFGPAKSVTQGGGVGDGASSKLTGYSILNADSLDAAVAMAKGCPILSSGGSVEVYETIKM